MTFNAVGFFAVFAVAGYLMLVLIFFRLVSILDEIKKIWEKIDDV